MNSTLDRCMRFLFAGIVIAAAPIGQSRARAQGFGPDPFMPYNWQYQQYTTPIAPTQGPAAMVGRGTGRGDNQFQRWIDEMDGASRLSTERYGLGVPYWKVRTDYERDRQERADRRNAQNEDVLGTITQKYLAYFSEEDPAKRAAVLREFTPRRADAAPDRPARRGADARDFRAPALDLDRGGRRDAGARSGAAGRLSEPASRRSSRLDDAAGGRNVPPAPVPSRFSSRTSRTQRPPSEVLDRSHRFDDDDSDRGTSPSRKRRATDRIAPAPPPE
jgi:hypothetical protein